MSANINRKGENIDLGTRTSTEKAKISTWEREQHPEKAGATSLMSLYLEATNVTVCSSSVHPFLLSWRLG
ncbi:hypothetical protein WMZ97_07870 [Lentibacillus sp. N15]|uniref:hypothetical protein n=1 Tax=Lentibacillus songyuanensis TaxID=3136161 RepID=UPI0031BAAA84